MTDSFVRFLEQNKDKSFALIAGPGNSGDILLKKGLEKYLQNNKYVISDVQRADVILIHGGNMNDVWHTKLALLKTVIEQHADKEIVVAPQTVYCAKANFERILNACKQEIYFFAREKESFTRLSAMKLNKNVHVYVAHDTAFLLKGTDYLQGLEKQKKKEYSLFSFRIDRESKFLANNPFFRLMETVLGMFGLEKLVRQNITYTNGLFKPMTFFARMQRYLRQKCGGLLVERIIRKNFKESDAKNTVIADVSLKEYDVFVQLITNSAEIYTDRLHVAILGALLGKGVHLYNDRYDKIKGVYEHSLQKFSNVIKKF